IPSPRLKTFASRPRLSSECASELETKVILSNLDKRQFIGGSEESPVSIEVICDANSSKHSSMLSKPDLEPKIENHGVQAWAGIIRQSAETSSKIFNNSLASKPKIGRPSECMLPIFSKRLLSSLTISRLGATTKRCNRRTAPFLL